MVGQNERLANEAVRWAHCCVCLCTCLCGCERCTPHACNVVGPCSPKVQRQLLSCQRQVRGCAPVILSFSGGYGVIAASPSQQSSSCHLWGLVGAKYREA